MRDQAARLARFHAPHAGPEAFIPGNAWSAGPARQLENGFGPPSEDGARTMRRAIATGLAGGSIEAAMGGQGQPSHGFKAAAPVWESGTGFPLAARAESFARGRGGLAVILARPRALAARWRDVLLAPNRPNPDAVAEAVGHGE